MSVATQRDADARRDPTQFNVRLLAREADAVAGAADVYSLPLSTDRRRFGFMVIVAPPYRRRGIGTALHRHIMNELDLGPVAGWEAAAWQGDPSGSAWLENLDFELASTHQVAERDLSVVDTSDYGTVIDAVEETGVELKSSAAFTARTPETVQQLYDLAVELSRDAPWYEDVSKPPLEVWRTEFIDSELILMDAFTVALAGDQLIGQSALMRDRHDESIIRTGLTGVRRGFRRRGIATAMKMRAIAPTAALSATEDGIRVQIGNAAENPMLDLNLKLGFKKQPASYIYSRSS